MLEKRNTGIYQIRNISNNDCYVGSAAVDFGKRWREHKNLLRRGLHYSTHLQSAWDKYGEECFIFEVLERVLKETLSLLLFRDLLVYNKEQHYLDTLKPKYNICKTAGTRLGTMWSEVSKSKIRGRLKTSEHREKLREAHLGVPLSEVTKQRMSIAKLGKMPNNKGKPSSEEKKQKQRVSGKIAWERRKING